MHFEISAPSLFFLVADILQESGLIFHPRVAGHIATGPSIPLIIAIAIVAMALTGLAGVELQALAVAPAAGERGGVEAGERPAPPSVGLPASRA